MDDTIYIVGGGPSLENYNWDLLRGRFVIGLNRAFEVLPWADIIYFTDLQFFEKYKDRGLLDHAGEVITIAGKIKDPRVTVFKNTGPSGLDLEPGCLRHGKNSGYAAINLAVHLHAARIVLLGFDMHSDTVAVTRIRDRVVRRLPGKTHWHSGYNRNVTPKTYAAMLVHFPSLAEPLKKLGIEIFNANPDSKIEAFPKISLESAHLVGTFSVDEHA